MFSREERDMRSVLGEMDAYARQRTNFSQSEAKELMGTWLANDRRFDSYDHGKLIDRVRLAVSNGAQLDLDDPALQRGGSPRPLSR